MSCNRKSPSGSPTESRCKCHCSPHSNYESLEGAVCCGGSGCECESQGGFKLDKTVILTSEEIDMVYVIDMANKLTCAIFPLGEETISRIATFAVGRDISRYLFCCEDLHSIILESNVREDVTATMAEWFGSGGN